jgi:hypothetical protein
LIDGSLLLMTKNRLLTQAVFLYAKHSQILLA